MNNKNLRISNNPKNQQALKIKNCASLSIIKTKKLRFSLFCLDSVFVCVCVCTRSCKIDLVVSRWCENGWDLRYIHPGHKAGSRERTN